MVYLKSVRVELIKNFYSASMIKDNIKALLLCLAKLKKEKFKLNIYL